MSISFFIHEGDKMANIGNLLNKLDKVKKKGIGRYVACCPVHKEKTPSLGITEDQSTGNILIHCFGCGANGVAVCEALGVDLADLFPESTKVDYTKKPERLYFNQSDVLELINLETTRVIVAAEILAEGGKLEPEDINRLAMTKTLLMEALSYVEQR